jgi:hypothetical protein
MLITIGLELQNSYSSAQKTVSYVHIGTLVDSTHRYKHLLAWFSNVLFDKVIFVKVKGQQELLYTRGLLTH